MPFDLSNAMMVFVRVSAMLSVMPVFSMTNFPVRARVGLGVLVAAVVAPGLPGGIPVPESVFGLVLMAIKEVGVGLLLGFVARLLFYTLEFAGSLVSLEMSLNMSQAVSPFTGSQNQSPGLVLFYLGGVIFLAMDMHHWMLVIFMKSFALAPIGAVHLNSLLLGEMVGLTSRMFVVGILMSAPILAVMFLINLVFAILGRTVPQMNVFMESFAVRIMTGLILFGATLNLMSQHIVSYLRRLPDDLVLVMQLLGTPG